MVISELRRRLCEKLNENGVADARFDSDVLIMHALGLSRTDLALRFDQKVDADKINELEALALRRISGEPLQYIVGKWEFYGLPFYVGEGVLIPRADTEVLVDNALEFLANEPDCTVVDLCSGSGCIAVSVAKNAKNAKVSAVELYEPAYSYLNRNVKLNNAAVKVIKADLFDTPDFDGIDLLLTNPPYIETDTINGLSQEVKREPKTALDGGEDGLDYYRAIAEKWLPVTRKCVMAEIGETQAADVTALFEQKGFACVTVKDLIGNDRVIIGTKNSI